MVKRDKELPRVAFYTPTDYGSHGGLKRRHGVSRRVKMSKDIPDNRGRVVLRRFFLFLEVVALLGFGFLFGVLNLF